MCLYALLRAFVFPVIGSVAVSTGATSLACQQAAFDGLSGAGVRTQLEKYQDEVGTEAYFTDYSTPDPKRVTNSAGDPFETFQERETGDTILTIVVNEATFSPIVTDQYKFTTNQQIVTIDGTSYAPGTLRLTLPTAQKVTEQVEGTGGTSESFTYYKVTYTVPRRGLGRQGTGHRYQRVDPR